MDKKTQMYVGVGVVAVLAYLAYNKMKKPVAKTAFAGANADSVVGRRVKMVGAAGKKRMMGAAGKKGMIAQNAVSKDSKFSYHFSGANKKVQDSGWVRADGKSIAPTFFNIKDSKFGR